MRNKIWLINNLVNHQIFNNIITVVILLQAAALALETFSEFNNYISLFEYINAFVLSILSLKQY